MSRRGRPRVLLGLLRVNSCLFEVFNSCRLTQMDKTYVVCTVFLCDSIHAWRPMYSPFRIDVLFPASALSPGKLQKCSSFRRRSRSVFSAVYRTQIRLFVSRRMTDHSVGCSPWPEIVDTRSSRNGSCRSPLAQVGRTSRLHAIIRFMTQPKPDTSLSSAPSKNISVKEKKQRRPGISKCTTPMMGLEVGEDGRQKNSCASCGTSRQASEKVKSGEQVTTVLDSTSRRRDPDL